jgi:hypothetical protein
MKYTCNECEYTTKFKSHFTDHIKSKRHEKSIAISKKLSEISSKDLKEGVGICRDSRDENKSKKLSPNSEETTSEDNLGSIETTDSKTCKYCYREFAHKSNTIRHMKICILANLSANEDIKKNEEFKKFMADLKCPYCKQQCTGKSAFTRHITSCINSNKITKEIVKTESERILELEKKLHEQEKKIYEYEKKITDEKLKVTEKLVEVLQEQNKNNNNLAVGNMCNVNGMIESNMRTMTFLNKFMNTSPCLENFKDDFEDPYEFYIDYEEHKKLKETSKLENTKNNILYYDEDKMTKDEYIIDHILYLQETKLTAKFIVDRLIHFYKKEGDAIKQSIWNIDMYRYNFTICLKTGNKTIWHSDKQGQITTEMILDPLLEFTSNIIQKQLDTYKVELEKLVKENNTTDMIKLVKKIEYLTYFIISVKNKELQQEIIKKLSPLMFFDVTKYKEDYQLEK